MSKIIIINGPGAAGKSTFVKYCKEIHYLTAEYSTVDLVKEAATLCGWDGTKDLKNRKFLSDLKDLLTEWNDVPFNATLDFIKKTLDMWDVEGFDQKDAVIFIHCREPHEIKRFEDEVGAVSLFIDNPNLERTTYGNHADDDVRNYNYTYTILNNGTLDDLKEKARIFIEKII